MDRFEDMRNFVRVVERKSFTKAAGDLLIPRATMSNSIQRLEDRLGTRLLERTTRTVKPTRDGEAYYQRCVRILADLEDADTSFTNPDPKGLLRVNLQGTLARTFVIPAISGFRERYRGIDLVIADGDRYVDLIHEGYDCVLRSGDLASSSMIARRLALLHEVTIASPDYLARFGTPRTIDDLQSQGHEMVSFLSGADDKPIPLDFVVDGKVREITLPASISVTGADSYAACASAGLGLIQVPRYRVADDLRAGRLVEVLPDFPPDPMPVSVLYPQNRQLSTRVRVFVDWLADLFAITDL
ncbi:LysR family transcriptional regulator [Thalassospira povalilytica]|uniref:LysR family transcriptional regulator n=1 Tax=Thalassospira povalilytica TaxID=732237 RepID=A0ABX4R8H0_9PROT|nr:LysR family transcriptional regulator [Thalassospira povalilytica]PKR50006.1 LysR family transcriptional regulator [Thalassospira povalilytica]